MKSFPKISYTSPVYGSQLAFAEFLAEEKMLEAFICGASRFSPRRVPDSVMPHLVRRDYLQNAFLGLARLGLNKAATSMADYSRIFLDKASLPFAWRSDIHLFYPGTGLGTMRALRRAGSKTRFVIDFPTTHPDFMDGQLALENQGRKHQIKPKSPVMRKRELAEISEADGILVGSSLALETFLNAGVDRRKIRVVRYLSGLNTDISRANYREHGEFRVLYVGGLSARKGIRYLIEAFLSLELINKKLILIGACDDPEVLKAIPEHDSRIEIGGVLRGTQLADEFSKASVFVLPSVEDGFGMVVAEAMSYGLASIVSSHAGARDLIVDGENGRLFQARNSGQLARILADYAGNPEELAAHGIKAKLAATSFLNMREAKDILKKSLESFVSDE